MSSRPPSKISIRHEWTRELDSKVAREVEGEVAREAKFSQSNQPTPNPIRDRSGRPILSEHKMSLNVSRLRTDRDDLFLFIIQLNDSQVCHEAETLNVDDEILCKRIEKSVVDHDVSHDLMMVNEADIPHSVLKYAHSMSVRQLSQKIENHPDRHALRQDPQKNQSCNPFSTESRKMIPDVGNIELPTTQCKVCFSYWHSGILLHKMCLFSVPEYVIKKRRPHGGRYGKKPRDEEYHTANQLKKSKKKPENP